MIDEIKLCNDLDTISNKCMVDRPCEYRNENNECHLEEDALWDLAIYESEDRKYNVGDNYDQF